MLKKQILSFILFILAIAVLRCLTTPLVPTWIDFHGLSWEQLKGFSAGTGAHETPVPIAAISSNPNSLHTQFAISKPFEIKTSYMELMYTGYISEIESKAFVVELRENSETGKVIFKRPFFLKKKQHYPNRWKFIPLIIDEEHIRKSAVLVLKKTPTHSHKTWVSVRNRLIFFDRSPVSSTSAFRRLQNSNFSPIFFALGVFTLVFLTAQSKTLWQKNHLFIKIPHPVLLTILFFFAATAIFYRSNLFFYYDEWYVLDRFNNSGFAAVFYPHNEHFIPLFFSLLYAETNIFGANYNYILLCSLALHALNTTLLIKFFTQLIHPHKHSSTLAFLLGLAFLVNALSTECTEWGMEQCILLAESITLLALIFGYKFLDSGNKIALSIVLAGVALAPLAFGNGFSIIFKLGGLVLFYLIKSGYRPRMRYSTELRRVVIILFLAALYTTIPAYLYTLNNETSTGHSFTAAKPFSDLPRVFAYLFVGTQFGTILRGSGLFPYHELGAAEEFFKSNATLHTWGLVIFACFGFILSLLPFVLSWNNKEERTYSLLYWLLGQSIIFSSILLPSLGRWQFGHVQSLALRYHYSTLVGFSLIFLPLFLQFWNSQNNLKKFTLKFLFICYCSVQLVIAHNYTYFSKNLFASQKMSLKVMFDQANPKQGLIDQTFTKNTLIDQIFTKNIILDQTLGENGLIDKILAAELRDWNLKLSSASPKNYLHFEAQGTPLEGLQPFYPQTITPQRYPDFIYSVLNWLDKDYYPQRPRPN